MSIRWRIKINKNILRIALFSYAMAYIFNTDTAEKRQDMSQQRHQNYKGWTLSFNHDLRIWAAYVTLEGSELLTAKTEKAMRALIDAQN